MESTPSTSSPGFTPSEPSISINISEEGSSVVVSTPSSISVQDSPPGTTTSVEISSDGRSSVTNSPISSEERSIIESSVSEMRSASSGIEFRSDGSVWRDGSMIHPPRESSPASSPAQSSEPLDFSPSAPDDSSTQASSVPSIA